MEKEKHLDILAVIFDIGITMDNSAVFQSQVMDQLIALSNMGYRVGLLCNYEKKDLFEKKIAERLRAEDIQIVSYEDVGFFKNLINMIIALNKISMKYKVSNAYTRGIWGSLIILASKLKNNIPYVYDLRGDLIDEAKAQNTNIIKIFFYRCLEKIALKYAFHVTSVTKMLIEIVKNRTRLQFEYSVIPSCIECSESIISPERRDKLRSNLGIKKDEIVFVYSGGLSFYQKVPEMLDLWHQVHQERDDVKFLLLTNSDPHTLPDEVIGIEAFGSSIKCLSLTRKDALDTLSLADIGFILRDDRDLNRAASPVKFAEYIDSGLAIICSPFIGDLSNHVRQNDLGVIVDPLNLDKDFNHIIDFIDLVKNNRERYQKCAKALVSEKYSWRSYNKSYISIYGNPDTEIKGIQ